MSVTIRTLTVLSALGLSFDCDERPSAPALPAAPSAHVEPARVAEPVALAAVAPPAQPAAPVAAPAEPPFVPVVTPEELDFMHEATVEHRSVSADEVKVKRFVLSHDVKGREPVDETDFFSTDTPKIFAFVELENGGAPYGVRVHFEAADGPALPYGIDLEVGSAPHFRTWAYTRIRREPGVYRAVLRTESGEDVATRTFTVGNELDAIAEPD
jgi:hypothetical protein